MSWNAKGKTLAHQLAEHREREARERAHGFEHAPNGKGGTECGRGSPSSAFEYGGAWSCGACESVIFLRNSEKGS